MMHTFHVIFTGDTIHKQSDMAAIARGAGGVVYGDVMRAVMDGCTTGRRTRSPPGAGRLGLWARSVEKDEGRLQGLHEEAWSGTIAKSIEDAKVACRRLVELAEIHGSNLRVWGCGGGMDQLVQISTPTGFIEPVDHMRPLNSRSTVNRDKQVNTRPATVTLTHRR